MKGITQTPEPDDAKPKPAIHYLARIGTLEGLLDQARYRRDKAEAENADLKAQLDETSARNKLLAENLRDSNGTYQACYEELCRVQRQYAALEQFVGVPQAKMAPVVEAADGYLCVVDSFGRVEQAAEYYTEYEAAKQRLRDALAEYRKWKDGQE